MCLCRRMVVNITYSKWKTTQKNEERRSSYGHHQVRKSTTWVMRNQCRCSLLQCIVYIKKIMERGPGWRRISWLRNLRIWFGITSAELFWVVSNYLIIANIQNGYVLEEEDMYINITIRLFGKDRARCRLSWQLDKRIIKSPFMVYNLKLYIRNKKLKWMRIVWLMIMMLMMTMQNFNYVVYLKKY